MGAQFLTASGRGLNRVVLAVALVAMAVSFGCGVATIALRPFKDAPEPGPLIEKYGKTGVEQALAALIGTRNLAYEHNRHQLESKVKLWKLCLGALTLGLVASTAALLTRR